MARRFVGCGGHHNRSGRLTQWIGPADQGYVTVAAGGSTLVSSASFDQPLTVMRSRGQVSIIPTVLSADLNIVGAFGMAIVSAEALAAGITSIPDPFLDADWGGWYVWRSFSYRFEFADATGVNFPNWSFEVDSKAMRKLTVNEAIVLVAESQGGGFSISTPIRQLVKLA